jgi:hypothetical protein
MKKILSTLIAFSVLLFTACEKNNIDTETEVSRKEQLAEISGYLDAIGMLETFPVTGIIEDTISQTQGSAVLLSFPYVPFAESEYYVPVTMEKQKYGNNLIGNNLSFQSQDAIYPGNLIQGISVRDNQLAPVPLSSYRNSGRIYLDVVSGQEGMNYTHDIAEFTGSCVTQAMNEILAPYTSGFPARFTFSQEFVHSKEEMAFYLDMNEDEFVQQTGGTFESVNWTLSSKTWIMIKLEQIYFTMTYDYLGCDSLFNDKMKIEYLKPYVYENNPLCYISSVSYGRYIVLLYEVDSRNQLIPNILGGIFSEQPHTFTNSEIASYQYTIQNASVRMIQIGGNAEDGLNALISPSPATIHKFIVDGSVFSKDNVGAPIYYTLRYVNNSRAVETYKNLNIAYQEVKYYEADKLNDVELTLNSIFSQKLTMSGGNGHLCNRSKFSVGNINFYVSVPNSSPIQWTLIKSIPSGITNVLTESSATSRAYYISAKTGELGANPTQQIRITFNVSYTNVRRIHYIIGSDDYPSETRTYEKELRFEYDAYTGKWKIIYNDSNPSNTENNPFHSIKFTDTFNSCNIGFELTYSFKANYRTYPY